MRKPSLWYRLAPPKGVRKSSLTEDLAADKIAGMTTEQRLAEASKLGRQAHANGKKCIPALDANFAPLLKGAAAGDAIALLDAWLEAWHAANIAS